jgi:hypothetical protein
MTAMTKIKPALTAGSIVGREVKEIWPSSTHNKRQNDVTD